MKSAQIFLRVISVNTVIRRNNVDYNSFQYAKLRVRNDPSSYIRHFLRNK